MVREKYGGNNPKVVVIGGGTGLSVLLRGMKNKDVDITAIVTVGDDGGSSGRIRSDLHIPPPGDIRNVLLALADVEPLLDSLFQHRFVNGKELAGHNLGNLIIAAMTEITGDFVTGIKALSRVLAVRGTVLPSAQQAIVLRALYEDGTTIVGESAIPLSGKRIKKIMIEPQNVAPLQESLEAIAKADAIVIGPGSLYTSILPNLLVPGITEAIRLSKAVKIYVMNVMTQPGETDGFTAADHIEAIHNHVGDGLFEYVIVNNGEIPYSMVERYRQKGQEIVLLDQQRLEDFGYRVIADDFILYETLLRHNANKVCDRIMEIVAKEHFKG